MKPSPCGRRPPPPARMPCERSAICSDTSVPRTHRPTWLGRSPLEISWGYTLLYAMPVDLSRSCSVPVVKNHHRDRFEPSSSAGRSAEKCLSFQPFQPAVLKSACPFSPAGRSAEKCLSAGKVPVLSASFQPQCRKVPVLSASSFQPFSPVLSAGRVPVLSASFQPQCRKVPVLSAGRNMANDRTGFTGAWEILTAPRRRPDQEQPVQQTPG
jgi:hypothetical protein